MYLCISPYTSMFLTTSLRYALSPQFMSWRRMPVIFLAVALYSFEGRFLVMALSFLCFFQPETMSYPSSVIILYISGISSGES